MLVLSRKVGDRIHIGADISITIVKLSGGTVRIGVEAPPHMAIVRDEIKESIEHEMNAASQPVTDIST
ncbi:MAG: carbon storage regulator [Planctomycetaceae bacterium]|nr:carbon storage regulator [Planctomycetaceae bacterium]|tara:strand:- start:168 stop:371 length:204 start_codon:yes stop_codon:yes gene_type:complete